MCNFLLRSSKLTQFLSFMCWKWGKKGKQRDMSDFDKGQIVMAGWLGQSISKTTSLKRCWQYKVVSTCQKCYKGGTTSELSSGSFGAHYNVWILAYTLYFVSVFIQKQQWPREKDKYCCQAQHIHPNEALFVWFSEHFPNINMSESFWRVVVYLSLH